MNNPEKIYSAAIRSIVNIYKDTGKEEIETIIPCIDYDLGQELRSLSVIAIIDHHCGGCRADHNQYHGFLTTKNRFVDAQTAKRIAIDAKQVPYPFDHYIGGYVEPLKAEDLY